jgi:hypothetical protein
MNKEKVNEIIQWFGAVFIIAGHVFNAIGPAVYPYNILVFTVGTVAFLTWAYRTRNTAQTVVNIVSIAICATGLYGAVFK